MAFRYKTILFDFDGTLTPSLPLWMQAYQFAFAKFGIELSGEEVIKKCFYRSWAELVVTYDLPSVEAFGEHVRQGLDEAFVDAVLFDGVIDFLDECVRESIKLGIVTSCPGKIVKQFMLSHNVGHYFTTIITADDITNHKPHPEPVEMALANLKAGPDQALFVGDSPVDLLVARATGLESALFFPNEHHVFYDFNHLLGHQPHLVFHNYAELKGQVAAHPDS